MKKCIYTCISSNGIKKCLQIMKISIFLMLFSVGLIAANTTYGQSTMLSLNIENKTLKEVFSEIEKNSEYIFFYNDNAVDLNKKVSVSIKGVSVQQVLDQVLDKNQTGFKVVDRQVIVYKKESIASNEIKEIKETEQAIIIKGKVQSSDGESLIGVSVVEKGTTNGVMTNSDGEYSIKVSKANTILVFTYIGFEPLEKSVNNLTVLNVTLQEKAADLDEVIVVAYGTQKKSSVTGAISVVNADKLKTVTTPNVNAMLQGKVAGVYVENISGRPGEAANIRIRGKGTLNSSVDPLWVVDGVVAGTGAQLNPNEIETISVLKDASATALYGSRAANGVIIVTTKNGKFGESKIDISLKLGVANQNLGNFKLMNSQELYDYTKTMDKIMDQAPWFGENVLSHDTDWWKFATQSALSQNYSISYSGGNEKFKTFISGDYYTEEGTVKGFDYNRFNIRLNNDFKVNDRLTLKTKIAGSYWNDDNKQHSIYSAMTYLPWDYPYNEDGTIRTGKEEESSGHMWYGRDKSNYLYNLQWNWARGKQIGINGTFGLDYKILDYLTFESSNNIGYRYHYTETYTDPRAQGAEGYKGSLENENKLTTTRYTNQLLRFAKIVNKVHAVSAFLGYEYSDYKHEKNSAIGRGLPAGKEVLDVTASAYKVAGSKNEWAMQSGYFNANYTYNDKYMAQLSFRYDGSSRFGKDKKYGSFYTIGGAWSIHNEEFMKPISFVDQLKVRASYGSIGNTPGVDYGHLTTYNVNKNYIGIPSAFPGTLGNSYMTWEKCYETNVALDARLFDRVNLTVDYYYKNTSDLLYPVALSSVSGYTKQYQNIGALRNEGIEITVSPEIIKTKDFRWDLDFNIGFNKNRINELYNGQPIALDGYHKRYTEGYDMDTWYIREWAGVDPQTGSPMWFTIDKDGNKSLTTNWNDATRQYLGSATPKFSGGIMTNLSYKNFTLSGSFSFVSGNKIYHSAREMYDNDGAYFAYNSMKLKDNWSRWEKPGDKASHPKAIAGGNAESNKASSRYLENGSFFKMKNLTLSYNIPSSVLNKLNLKYGSISVSGENLFTITKFSGIDPEVATAGGTGDSKDRNGLAGASIYPSVRRFSVGLNLSF